MIISGDLAPGLKVNEAHLAESLGISRTPLREALRGLQIEGLIRSEHNRGFWITDLDSKEVQELYPIVWTLEGLAMKDGWRVLKAGVEKLREANARFRSEAENPRQAATTDEEFHSLLISCSPNRRLATMLVTEKAKIRRYEALYMEDSSLVSVSSEQHEQIIQEIAHGEQSRAIEALESNWRFGMDALLAKIHSGL
jgi:DNA-binding GntR family transcriptional regulator